MSRPDYHHMNIRDSFLWLSVDHCVGLGQTSFRPQDGTLPLGSILGLPESFMGATEEMKGKKRTGEPKILGFC
jgi:hypothetical protein